MKVTKFKAVGVHGYLEFDLEFLPDLTFITGLNGSGKTSALRLLMGLLTPQFETLANIAYKVCSVTVSEGEQEIVISAERTDDGLRLSLTTQEESLFLSTAELQLLAEPRPREEARPPVHARVGQNSVVQSIASISTPMFLGLDRRFHLESSYQEESPETRRRDLLMRRMWREDEHLRGTVATGLIDVTFLVLEQINEIRTEQEKLDKEFREQILLGAFRYRPANVSELGRMPSRTTLEEYRQRQARIESAATELRLPLAEVRAALTDFFDRMNEIVSKLEEQRPNQKTKHKPQNQDHAVFDWLVNKPQADRVFEHLASLESYSAKRAILRAPLERFLSLANTFLEQTGKTVNLSEQGQLEVILMKASNGHKKDESSKARPKGRSTGALSSGERQIVVMLAHLTLNKRLTGSGVFIVDEPELSLHLAWQERFVEAIQEANPNVQLIMATHSPAIILDRTEHCRNVPKEVA